MLISSESKFDGSSSISETVSGANATLRHDLRTFLNHIVGYCDLVTQDAPDNALGSATAALPKLASEASAIVEHLNGLYHPELPAHVNNAISIRAEIIEFGNRVASICGEAKEEVHRHQADYLTADLLKIQNAALGMSELAASLTDATEHGRIRQIVVETDQTEITQKENVDRSPIPHAATQAQDLRQVGGFVLVVDDNADNRDLLKRFLERDGLTVECASGGREGLEKLSSCSFDLVLLDLLMPEIDGFAVLRQIKGDSRLRHLPVVILSALNDLPKVLACIEAGAEDYLSKPFNPILMRSRVRLLLERKRLQEEERRRTLALETALCEVEGQKKISEQLLSNILPNSVAQELREKGYADPMYFEDATIVLTDFVGFTASTEKLPAEELVDVLHSYFTAFDQTITKYGLEKLKTIGDSYMFASGLPERSGSHPVDAVMAALDMIHIVEQMAGNPVDWTMRVGIHTGPVIAGVVGIRKFAFDVWGESVNLASRMESSGAPNRINVSERTYVRIKDFFSCEHRGKIKTKEGREMDMYFVNEIVPKLLEDVSTLPPRSFSRRYKVYFQKNLVAFPDYLAQPGVASIHVQRIEVARL